jgi:hypothetical protein
LGEDGLRMDPFTLGLLDADKPIHNPREYFLTVLRIRLNQVRREWQQVVEKLSQVVRAYEKVCWHLLFVAEPFSEVVSAQCPLTLAIGSRNIPSWEQTNAKWITFYIHSAPLTC